MTDAQIDAFFGPLRVSRFTGNSGRTIRKIPTRKGAQHAWALVNEAPARRVLSNRGKPEYARLLMMLDVPAAGCAQCGRAWCSLLTFVVRACVLATAAVVPPCSLLTFGFRVVAVISVVSPAWQSTAGPGGPRKTTKQPQLCTQPQPQPQPDPNLKPLAPSRARQVPRWYLFWICLIKCGCRQLAFKLARQNSLRLESDDSYVLACRGSFPVGDVRYHSMSKSDSSGSSCPSVACRLYGPWEGGHSAFSSFYTQAGSHAY